MQMKCRFFQILLIGLSLLLVGFIVACDSKNQERQQLIDYLNDMLPVMTRQANLYDDWLDFTQRGSLTTSQEMLDKLGEVKRRAQDIYMEVERSLPPYPLRDFKQKWSKELQLMQQALSLAAQGLLENNFTLLREADDLIFESNNLKTEYTNDLLDLLAKYDIDVTDFSP